MTWWELGRKYQVEANGEENYPKNNQQENGARHKSQGRFDNK